MARIKIVPKHRSKKLKAKIRKFNICGISGTFIFAILFAAFLIGGIFSAAIFFLALFICWMILWGYATKIFDEIILWYVNKYEKKKTKK